jgi:hypothetical protein
MIKYCLQLSHINNNNNNNNLMPSMYTKIHHKASERDIKNILHIYICEESNSLPEICIQNVFDHSRAAAAEEEGISEKETKFILAT